MEYSLSSYSSYAIDSARNVIYWYDVAANTLKAGSFANFAAGVSVTSVGVNQTGSLWYSSMKYVGKGIVLLQYNQREIEPIVLAFNFSDLANPTFLGFPSVAKTWFESGNFIDGYGYVGTQNPSPTALLVYDFFTTPLVPSLVATFNISSDGGSMYILGISEDRNTVYVNRQFYTAHVYAIDITHRTTPSVLYMLPISVYIVTVAKVGNTLWVGTDSMGLYVYDVSLTSNISLITVNDVVSRTQGTNNQVVSLSASSKYVFASIYNYVVAYSSLCLNPASTGSASSSTGPSSTTGAPSSTTGSSVNATVVVQVSVTLSMSGDPNAFNKTAFIAAFAAELGIPVSSVNLTIVLEAKRSVYAGFKVLLEAQQTLPADTPATILQQFNATTIRATIEAALVAPGSPLRDSVAGFTVGQVTASTTITENTGTTTTTTATTATSSPATTTTGNDSSASTVALSLIVFCLAVLANL